MIFISAGRQPSPEWPFGVWNTRPQMLRNASAHHCKLSDSLDWTADKYNMIAGQIQFTTWADQTLVCDYFSSIRFFSKHEFIVFIRNTLPKNFDTDVREGSRYQITKLDEFLEKCQRGGGSF